jgi:hypothetical protein
METTGMILSPATALREIHESFPVYRAMNNIHDTGSVNTPMKRMYSQNNLEENAGLADFIASANNQIAQEKQSNATACLALGTERLRKRKTAINVVVTAAKSEMSITGVICTINPIA